MTILESYKKTKPPFARRGFVLLIGQSRAFRTNHLGRGLVANDPVKGESIVQRVATVGDGKLERDTDFVVSTWFELHADSRGDDVGDN